MNEFSPVGGSTLPLPELPLGARRSRQSRDELCLAATPLPGRPAGVTRAGIVPAGPATGGRSSRAVARARSSCGCRRRARLRPGRSSRARLSRRLQSARQRTRDAPPPRARLAAAACYRRRRSVHRRVRSPTFPVLKRDHAIPPDLHPHSLLVRRIQPHPNPRKLKIPRSVRMCTG